VTGAEIAVIGGSGFYEWFDAGRDVLPSTPYGPTSGPISLGTVGNRSVAFLPRHGRNHQIAPHAVNSRANLWALRELGVQRVIGPCAVGSLRADLDLGDLVILDQLVDRTWGRDTTYLDGDLVEHVSFADPYCPQLRSVLATAARPGPGAGLEGGWSGGAVNATGTVVVVQGPRFSTRAESRVYQAAGIDVINMTQYPEAYLARELGLCYAGLALVTDRDVGVEGDPSIAPVTMEAALAVLAANVDHTRNLLAAAIPAIPAELTCSCATGGAPSLRR
jgi:5'-methylthioadenosine phosphorylase